MRGTAAAVVSLTLLAGFAWAQTNAPSAADNPLAGLTIDGTNAAPTPAAPEAPQSFLGKFQGHLDVVNNGHFKPADRDLLNNVKYVAFYYSASWCGPCREFTPKLVEFYNEFKPSHPNFELIFVNDDQNSDDMLDYMVNDKMLWPAVHFDDIDSRRLRARQFAGNGIPDLVLVDYKGNVLADSYVNGEYVGPYRVMDQIQQIVSFSAPPPSSSAP